MSAVGSLSETVESLVPSRGGAEPAPSKYVCRNCGRDVDADADACHNCSSTNLRPLYL